MTKRKSLNFSHGELLRYPDKEGYALNVRLKVYNTIEISFSKKPTKKQINSMIKKVYSLLEHDLRTELNYD